MFTRRSTSISENNFLPFELYLAYGDSRIQVHKINIQKVKSTVSLWINVTINCLDICANFKKSWGTWVTQSIKRPTLDFGSGHGLMVHGLQPHVGLCTGSMEPSWGGEGFSLLSGPPHLLMHTHTHTHTHTLSLSLSHSLSLKNNK